jgi:hypothetical protein
LDREFPSVRFNPGFLHNVFQAVMGVTGGDGFIRFLPSREDKAVFGYPVFRQVFPQEVQSDVRQRNNTKPWIYFSPLPVILDPCSVTFDKAVNDKGFPVKEDLFRAQPPRLACPLISQKAA